MFGRHRPGTKFVLVCCPKDRKIPTKTRTNFLLKIVPRALNQMSPDVESGLYTVPVAVTHYENMIIRRTECDEFFKHLDESIAAEAEDPANPYRHLVYRFYRLVEIKNNSNIVTIIMFINLYLHY